MKKIETVIPPSQWEEARAQLKTLGVSATLREVRTFGRTPAKREVYRGSAFMLDTATELELTMLVQDELLEATLAALDNATGDAEIIVTSVERLVHARKHGPVQPQGALRVVPERTLSVPVVMPASVRA